MKTRLDKLNLLLVVATRIGHAELKGRVSTRNRSKERAVERKLHLRVVNHRSLETGDSTLHHRTIAEEGNTPQRQLLQVVNRLTNELHGRARLIDIQGRIVDALTRNLGLGFEVEAVVELIHRIIDQNLNRHQTLGRLRVDKGELVALTGHYVLNRTHLLDLAILGMLGREGPHEGRHLLGKEEVARIRAIKD